MSKNIGANRVKIVDNSGNEGSQLWSRVNKISLASVDFNPGFSFEVLVVTGGAIVVHPSDNDSVNTQINEMERALYTGNITITVPNFTKLPFLCDKIIKTGTDATNIYCGR